MIYFYNEIVEKTLEEIKDAYDCIDIFRDINRINQAIAGVKSGESLVIASQLDQELREKYPRIDEMINFANALPLTSPQAKIIYSANDEAISRLNQDYYGILCDTAIKKGFTQNIRPC